MDEDCSVQCYESSCRREINLYDEEVRIWKKRDPNHPAGFRQIFLCAECEAAKFGAYRKPMTLQEIEQEKRALNKLYVKGGMGYSDYKRNTKELENKNPRTREV